MARLSGPTVRQTSKAAYDKLKASGLLTAQRWDVYDTVFHHGPVTSAEGFKMLEQSKNSPIPISQTRARFTELRDSGLLREVGMKRCTVTGRNVILWDVTSCDSPKLPIKPAGRITLDTRKSKADLLSEVEDLTEENTKLKELARRAAYEIKRLKKKVVYYESRL